MKNKRKRIFALAALLLAVCLALVACGSNGEEGGTETKPVSTTATAAVTKPADPPKSEKTGASKAPQEPGKLEPGDGTHDTDDGWTDFY
ncbi:MAG TPA: hypothetical protein DDW30_07070 [Clostridiales bacterium]|nr:hypothetical protein [Clostridiales bacterium]